MIDEIEAIAHDHRIVTDYEESHQNCHPAEPFEILLYFAEGFRCRAFHLVPQTELQYHKRDSGGEQSNQPSHQEGASAGISNIWKTPDVSQTNGRADSCQNECCATIPPISWLHVLLLRSSRVHDRRNQDFSKIYSKTGRMQARKPRATHFFHADTESGRAWDAWAVWSGSFLY